MIIKASILKMDQYGYIFLICINSVIIIGSVPSYYNETYDGYTLIMPLTNGDTRRSPLTFLASLLETWCSTINSNRPRITDESDQKNIVQFIRNAVRKFKLDRTQHIFLNNIYHTFGDWTWVNGQTNQGFTVKSVSKITGADEYFFGYLWTNDYRISESRPLELRRYICETSEHSSNSSHCEMKLDKRCYWKKDDLLTWYKARNACLKQGGDLASFDALNEKDLKDSLKDLGLIAEKSYWVGIYKSVWRWNDNGIDPEIKYSNWKDKHPSNYNAKCLCLDKSHNYEWIECECDRSYPFICKRNETSSQSPLPIDQQPNTSVISETVRLALVLSSCALIVVIVIFAIAAFIIRKQRNRPDSSPYQTSEAATNVFPICEEIEDSRENKSSANCSASSPSYATVQRANSVIPVENSLYGDLDL